MIRDFLGISITLFLKNKHIFGENLDYSLSYCQNSDIKIIFRQNPDLTILTWKNLCFTEFNTKFVQISEKRDSSNRQ